MNYNHNLIIVEIKERNQLKKEKKQLIINWYIINKTSKNGHLIYKQNVLCKNSHQ